MGSFSGDIDLRALSDGDHWKTLDPIAYKDDAGEALLVPAGFITDLASVPRVFWNILPPFGKYDGAAILHDWLYSTQQFTRSKSDGLLLEALESEGVSWLTRWVIYLGVRAGGWAAWDGHTQENISKIGHKK